MTRQLATLILLAIIWLCCTVAALGLHETDPLVIAAVTSLCVLVGYSLIYK